MSSFRCCYKPVAIVCEPKFPLDQEEAGLGHPGGSLDANSQKTGAVSDICILWQMGILKEPLVWFGLFCGCGCCSIESCVQPASVGGELTTLFKLKLWYFLPLFMRKMTP